MQKRWICSPSPKNAIIEELSQAIRVNHTLSSILIQRGISTFDQAKHFFRPSLDQLHDPFMMKNMKEAVDRLQKAIDKKEKIIVYGDYDVDGTSSVALIYSFLKSIYSSIDFYIPDRQVEGYGVSLQGIEWASQQGCSLLITVDCGIKDFSAIQYASSLGIESIICDHHIPTGDLPPAIAILNPKQPTCPYPYKELSGCGVAFKLLSAFCQENKLEPNSLYKLLDLVAVSIASDIVPITGENRLLMYHGLNALNTAPSLGLSALMAIAGLHSPIDVSDIVFGIAPRINAAGRLGHASQAVQLLLAQTESEASVLAKKLHEQNAVRRTYDLQMTQEALALIENNKEKKEAKSTVLFKEDWHKGVIGIVASRCVEKYYRPTIILTASNEKAVGSARSVDGFDIHEAITACSDLLEKYGGHQYAAGLTLPIDRVDDFSKRFEEVVSNTIAEEQLIPLIEVDLLIQLKLINSKFYTILQQMAPFGPGNKRPVFVAEDVFCVSPPIVLKQEHLKLRVKQDDSYTFDAIGFGLGHYITVLQSGKPFDICFTIQENTFNGNTSLQLSIKDIRTK